MPGFEKTSNRLISFFIYSLLIVIVISAGTKVIQYSTDIKFYNRFLLKWESALTTALANNMDCPIFTGKNHVEYMDNLVRRMEKIPVSIPSSNSSRPYVYHISKTGESNLQSIFLLYLENKIILYGLSKTTFNMLDKNIDGKIDKKAGAFKGKLQKDNEHYAGIWEL